MDVHERKFVVSEKADKERQEVAIIPTRATIYSAGYDICSAEAVTIPAGEMRLVRTGIAAMMPGYFELQLRARSGLAYKKQITLQNGIGTIDADYYPNEIGVLLRNEGKEDFVVNIGDKIAQAVFSEYYITVDDSVSRDRDGGFGSTGV